MKTYNIIIAFVFFSTSLIAQGGAQTCNELQTNPQLYQSCATSVPFVNQIVSNTENINPSCFSEPIKAPTWFFIKIKNSGDINLQISQVSNFGNGLDVDFCLWGPFTTVNNVCGALIPANQIDCSWLPASVENVQITGAIQNQIYILLVDNYAQISGTISITQTGGTGSSDCSFLSSVKIKDTNNAEITQLDYCKPASKTLKSIVNVTDFTANVADLRFNYRWKKDDVVVQTLNNSLSNTNFFTATSTGLYKIEIAVYDVTDTTININTIPFTDDQSDEIELNFYQTPVLNNIPIAVEQCDFITPNNDGISNFNLVQYYNQITNTISGINLKYYLNASLTQEILNPANFTNTTAFAQSIYVVGKINSNLFTCNSNTAVLNLTITPTSTTNYPNITPVCSELNLNYGLINFETQRINIKNNFFSTSNVSIQFYINQLDATLEQNQLQNSTQLPVGISTIFTKIKSGNNCSGVGTFFIEIKGSPILNLISTVNRCKNDIFILNSKDNEALLNQNSSVQCSYFYSFDNAKNNVNSINKNAPLNLVQGQTIIFIRLFNIISQCFSVVNFEINIFANPTLNINPTAYAVCGNLTGVFNLNSRLFDLIGSNNYAISFYETSQDLINNLPITNPNSYLSIGKTIFVKATDTAPANCTSRTTLKLEVNAKPGSSVNPTPFLICDNDGFSTFNLKSKESEMTGISAISSLLFKYYENDIDALQNNNNTVPNPENYTNSTKYYQKIYVRINNLNPALFCFSILEISIFVSEFPTNNLVNLPYKICKNTDGSVSEEAFIDTKLITLDYKFLWFNNFDTIAGNEILGQTNSTFSTPNEGQFSVKIISKLTPARCVTTVNFTTKNLVIPTTLKFSPQEVIAFEQVNQVAAIASPTSDEYEYLLNYGD